MTELVFEACLPDLLDHAYILSVKASQFFYAGACSITYSFSVPISGEESSMTITSSTST